MKKPALFFLLSFLLSSCGIEGFEAEYKLNPPLDLRAEVVSNEIRLTFWAYNSESYFSGFSIFMASSADDLQQKKGFRIPNKENYPNRATIWQNIQPMSEPTEFSYLVTEDLIREDANNKDLISGFNYYFSVRAYSESYLIYSKDSNITNVIFSNL